jgi:hypothetical protein
MSKKQVKRGTAKNLFVRAPENTEHGVTYTLHTTGLCNIMVVDVYLMWHAYRSSLLVLWMRVKEREREK